MMAPARAQLDRGYHNLPVQGNSIIFCIAEDEDGLLWLGGERGLFTYDGYRLLSRPLVGTISQGANVNTLCFYGKEVLVGTTKGLWAYNRLSGHSYPVKAFAGKDIRSITAVGRKVYVGDQRGISVGDWDTQQWKPFYQSIRGALTMVSTRQGWLVGNSEGLYHVRNSEVRLLLPGKFVTALLPAADGHCWVGTADDMYDLDLLTDKLVAIPQLHKVTIKTLARDHAGYVLIGSDDGLYVMTGSDIRRVAHDSRDPASLGNNVVWDIHVDRWGNVWMGNDIGLSVQYGFGGLLRAVPLFDLTGSTGGNLLRVTATDSRHNLWLGGTNGLIRLAADGHAQWYRQGDATYPITHNRIRCCYEDADGDVWIATDNGINYYDRSTGRLRNFILSSSDNRTLTRWVYGVIVDRQHRLWVGGYEDGIFIVSKDKLLKSNGVCQADHHLTSSGIASPHVYALVQTATGSVWVSSAGGLDIVDPRNYTVRHVTDQVFSSVAVDSRGRVWAGDRKGDIVRYVLSHGRIVTEQYPGNGIMDAILGIVSTGGQVYAFSSSLCRVFNDRGSSAVFRLPASNVTGCGYDNLRHRFILLGVDRFITVGREAFAQPQRQVKMMLSAVLLNDTIDWTTMQRLADKEKITFRHDESNLAFVFSDLPHTRGMRQLYAYRLRGLDKKWNYFGDDMQARYTKIPPGSYTLEVALVGGAQESSKVVYSMKFRVLHPWYASPVAWMVYVLFLVALALFIRRFVIHLRSLRKMKSLHDSILLQSERRRRYDDLVAEELKKNIAQTLISLQNITSIATTPQARYGIGQVRSRISRLNMLVRQAFGYDGGSKPTDYKGLTTKVAVVDFCRQAIGQWTDGAVQHGVDIVLPEGGEGDLTVNTDIVRLDAIMSILYNYLVTNSASHAVVTTNIRLQASAVTIAVATDKPNTDSGKLPTLFERPATRRMTASPADDAMALYLAKGLAEEIEGSVKASWTDSGRLVFLLTLPGGRKEARGSVAKPITIAKRSASVATKAEKEEKTMDEDNAFLRKVDAVIEKHIADTDLNVALLMHEMGLGRKYLYRRLKAITGYSPVEYIRKVRMDRAAHLIKSGKYNVSEVMYQVGYSNTGYFSRSFHQVYGVTPSKYMKAGKS